MGEQTSQVFLSLRAITNGATLDVAQAEATLGEIMDGEASNLQVAALLGALRMRGETIEEITGFARAMKKRAIAVHTQRRPLVDTCGTGGDASVHSIATFNVSTAASFIAAAAGVAVAKHGNRAMSSRCGSADVLEALGIHLNSTPEQIGRSIDEVGIGFMFAPAHHPAMKQVVPIRRELGIRTVFNLLGPLVNPAGATAQVMGVSDRRWIEPIARVLAELGTEHAIVAHSRDGMDEFSTCAETDYIEIRDGKLQEHVLSPHELNCACTDANLLEGGDAETNAEIIQRLLQDGKGAPADIAVLNAAAAIMVGDAAPDFPNAVQLARETLERGDAWRKLQELISFTNNHS